MTVMMSALILVLATFVVLLALYIFSHTFPSSLQINFTTPITLLDIIKAYVRVLTKIPKKTSAQQILTSFPKIKISAPLIGNEQHLQTYLEKLGEKENTETLPPFYLNALTGSFALLIGSHPLFPIRLLGSVNTSTQVKIHTPVLKKWLMKNELRSISQIGTIREVRRGIEFDIETLVYKGEQLVWSSVFRALQFMKTTISESSSMHREASSTVGNTNSSQEVYSFNLSSLAGRTYASLCLDYNPIHIHNIGAKLFGFPKMIAHGMWVVAQADAKSPKPLVKRDIPQQIEVFFKKPTFLPASLSVKVNSVENEIKLSIDRVEKNTTTVVEGEIKNL